MAQRTSASSTPANASGAIRSRKPPRSSDSTAYAAAYPWRVRPARVERLHVHVDRALFRPGTFLAMLARELSAQAVLILTFMVLAVVSLSADQLWFRVLAVAQVVILICVAAISLRVWRRTRR